MVDLNSNRQISYQQALENYYNQAEFSPVELSIEQSELLKQYHPDHQDGAMINLRLGINAGLRCHKQIVEMLEAKPRITPGQLDAISSENTVVTDILVIGGGGAGCAAALTAVEAGANVILATKLRLGDSNTVMAEGGIQASVNSPDSPQAHFDDTWKAGHQAANPALVKQMVLDGPQTIHWLMQRGMQFDLSEAGELLTRKAGGTSANRVAFYKDYTGLEMMRVLRDCVRQSDVDVWEYAPTLELVCNSAGRCIGAIISTLQDKKTILIKASAVILATGGIGRVHLNHFPTSNHFGATGDGVVLAYRAGARLRDLDTFQYHPTGLAWPQHLSGTLITEGVRSSGAYLINAFGERFVNELSPRDIVAAAIIRECDEGRGVLVDAHKQRYGVWLDTPGLEQRNPGILQQRFPKLVKLGLKSDIDVNSVPILIYPTLHYQNGGVEINDSGLSSVTGLYCVGEVSGGIHGRNRLMGNALLDIISFGRKAGVSAVSEAHEPDLTPDYSQLKHWYQQVANGESVSNRASPLLFPDYANFDSLNEMGN
jgi:succinate dehydrogenase / fumarate reductase flavoprotein subunit/L-aspartate oxidase